MKDCNSLGGKFIPKCMFDNIASVCSDSDIVDFVCIFGSYLFGYDGDGSNVTIYLESRSMSSYDMLCSVEFHKLYAEIRVSLCEYFESIGKGNIECDICYFGKNELDFIRSTKWYSYIDETGYLIYSV